MKHRLILLIVLLASLSLPVMAVTYEDLARYPDKYIGQTITFTGEVTQPDYTSSDGWGFRLYTKKATYGNYYTDDDLYVVFTGIPSGGRVLEDDMIQVTGIYAGPWSYTTVLGAQREVPLIKGVSYVLNPLGSRY